MSYKTRTVTLGGNPVKLIGTPLEIGQKAPEFQAVDLNMKPYFFEGGGGRYYGNFLGRVLGYGSMRCRDQAF